MFISTHFLFLLVSCAYKELCVNGCITLPAFLCTFISFGDTVEGSLVGLVLVVGGRERVRERVRESS